MARKNLLANVTANIATSEEPRPLPEARFDYARRGASRSMMQSLDEMADIAKKMMSCDAIVSIDPAQIDVSFVQDRIEDEMNMLLALRRASKIRGEMLAAVC